MLCTNNQQHPHIHLSTHSTSPTHPLITSIALHATLQIPQVALLDMLANGTNPRKIVPYLSDCYDALAGLRFVQV